MSKPSGLYWEFRQVFPAGDAEEAGTRVWYMIESTCLRWAGMGLDGLMLNLTWAQVGAS